MLTKASQLSRRALQVGQDFAVVIFHEQHGADDDIAPGDIRPAPRQCLRIVPPLRRRVQAKRQSGEVPQQPPVRPFRSAREVGVHCDDYDADRHGTSRRCVAWENRPRHGTYPLRVRSRFIGRPPIIPSIVTLT